LSVTCLLFPWPLSIKILYVYSGRVISTNIAAYLLAFVRRPEYSLRFWNLLSFFTGAWDTLSYLFGWNSNYGVFERSCFATFTSCDWAFRFFGISG
jgi:hypothetical protein